MTGFNITKVFYYIFTWSQMVGIIALIIYIVLLIIGMERSTLQ
jgi:hypothetical protein